MLDNLVLPRDGASLLQPFIIVVISRGETIAATSQLQDELILQRGEMSYGYCNPISYAGLNGKELSWSSNPISYAELK
jgi:hypothetical protein